MRSVISIMYTKLMETHLKPITIRFIVIIFLLHSFIIEVIALLTD